MGDNDREWGLAMMLTHGFGGMMIGAELGLIAWAIYHDEAARSELLYPLAEELIYIAKASVAGFFGGCAASKLIYNSSPFFFWSKPKEYESEPAASCRLG